MSNKEKENNTMQNNNITIFTNKDLGTVRTLTINNEPWFVAKDVCDCLAINYTSKAASKLEADELMRIKLPSGGQTREMLAVNEYGLYNLVLRSNKPEAKQFKRWITHEVLPSIRKHGGYINNQENMSPEEFLSKALIYANNKLEDIKLKLAEKTDEVKKLAETNKTLSHKASYYDLSVKQNFLLSIRNTAKEFEIQEKQLIRFLLENKYLYRNCNGKLYPYAKHVNNGNFQMKECVNERTGWIGIQTYITPKGRNTIRLAMELVA